MTYVIYHIPGKKIGVTNNLKSRVEDQQGYTEDEYEVLEMSDDIGYISDRELELQKQYGYRIDRQLYKDLYTTNFIELNKMKINVTEATTTFPCPINKLKGRLMDEKGMQWTTDHGTFTINAHSINWIINNAKESMYNKERCYVYNKAFASYYDRDPMRNMAMGPTHEAETEYEKGALGFVKKQVGSNMSQFDLIREWANERGLYDKGDPKTQYVKLIEEAGEVGRAILKKDTPEIIDGIGDMVVVLTNLAELTGTPIEDCIQAAYDVISKRTGKMKNGTFVKDTL